MGAGGGVRSERQGRGTGGTGPYVSQNKGFGFQAKVGALGGVLSGGAT